MSDREIASTRSAPTSCRRPTAPTSATISPRRISRFAASSAGPRIGVVDERHLVQADAVMEPLESPRAIRQPAARRLLDKSFGICEGVDVARDDRLRGDQPARRADQAIEAENEEDEQPSPRPVAAAVNHHGEDEQSSR